MLAAEGNPPACSGISARETFRFSSGLPMLHQSPTWPELNAASEPGINEKRLHRRFELALGGRFMRADKAEHPCSILDVSVGGIALAHDGGASAAPMQGENIIAYIDQLGGLEGPVVRIWAGGFAFKLNATQHKREKLASQVTWILNAADLAGAAARRHERVAITDRSATLTVSGAVGVPCVILDVSLSGASLACKVRPETGSEVWLDRLRAFVVRHHAEGIGIQFRDQMDHETMLHHFG
jgi:hypothetical protein